MKHPYFAMMVAIIAEVFATTMLKLSNQFTCPLPSMLTVLGYCLSFYALSIALHSLSTGIVYAIWSGVGIVLISGIGWWAFNQPLDKASLLGMALIIAGVLVINLFSHRMSVD